jgi:EAL domain-containing protein (putative c-di-GMP-specific phosphodiesterase class I)
MEIVAEGIETQGELDTLLELGVALGQGFYLAEPAPL